MVSRESAKARQPESYVEDKIGTWISAKFNLGIAYLLGSVAVHGPWLLFVAYTSGEGQIMSIPTALSAFRQSRPSDS